MVKHWLVLCLTALAAILPMRADAQDREIAELAKTLSSRISTSGKKAIAVMDIGNPQTCVTRLGRYISEELVGGLLESGPRFGLVNRVQLQKVLAELKLGQSGLTDPSTTKQFGRLAGADALLVGTMTFFGDTVRVNVQVLDAETAATVAVAATSISRTAAIDKLNECLDTPAPVRTEAPPPPKVVEPVVKAGYNEAAESPNAVPTFLRDGIKASIGQVVLAAIPNTSAVTWANPEFNPPAFRVALNMTIENTSREALHLAFEAGGADHLALSDDRATIWKSERVNGLQSVNTSNGVSRTPSESFTVIGPGERTVVIMSFVGGEPRKPSTSFTLIADAVYYFSSGAKKVSIALSGIKPVGQPR